MRYRVITHSINELKTKTNLVINYKTIKQGRRVHAIEFTFLDYSKIKKKTRGKTTKEVIDMMQKTSEISNTNKQHHYRKFIIQNK